MAVKAEPEIPQRPARNPIRVKRHVKPERAAFGRSLRRDRRPNMRRRRAIVALSFGSIGALGVIGLYQFGITPHVPEPPLRRFRGDAVSASGDGYIFETPDALIGMASYAVTAVLAAMGPPDRAERQPWQPLLMAGKVAVDAANALRLTGIQVRQLKFFCAWCLTTSALTLATVPLALPEAREAFRTVRANRKAYRGR